VLDVHGESLSQGSLTDSTKWRGWNFSEGNAYQNGALQVHLEMNNYVNDDPDLAWDAWASAGIGYKLKLKTEGGDFARRTDGSAIGEPRQFSFDDVLCIDMEYTGKFRNGVTWLRVDFDETKRFSNYENIFDSNNSSSYNPAHYDIPNGQVYGGRATVKIPIGAVDYSYWDSNAPESWAENNAADVFRILIHRLSAPAEEHGPMTDPGTEVLKIYRMSKNDC
jgi:hypothetical protein